MDNNVIIYFSWKALSVVEALVLLAFFLSVMFIAATGLYDMYDQGEEKTRNQKIFGISVLVQIVALAVFCVLTFRGDAGYVHYVLNPFILTPLALLIGWGIRVKSLRNGTPMFKGWGGK